MFKFFLFFAVFNSNVFSFHNFEMISEENKSLGESRIENKSFIMPLEAINEYKKFFESINLEDLEEIKKEISLIENSERITDEQNYLILKFRESFSNLEKLKKRVEKFIKDYEFFIESFFNEKTIFNKNYFFLKKTTFDELKNYIFLESLLKEKLNFLEKEIFEFQNNDNYIYLSNNFFEKNNNEEKSFYKKDFKKKINKNFFLKKKIDNYLEFVKKAFLKEKELELKILISKKSFYLEEINSLKELIEKSKSKDFFTKEELLEIAKNEKIQQKRIFEKNNSLIKDYEDFLNLDEEKNLQKVTDYSLDVELENLIENLKEEFKDLEFLKEKFSLLSRIIEKEYRNAEIEFIEKTGIINEKNIELVESWIAICDEKTDSTVISKLMEKMKVPNLQLEAENLEKQKDRLLQIITNYSLIEKILKKNFSENYFFEDNYINDQKSYLLKIVDFYNELIPEVKKIKYITIDIKEDLTNKKFWVRSKNSISLEEFSNFIPDIKLFLLNLKKRFVPFLKDSYSFILLKNKVEKINYVKYLLIFIVIFFTGIVYSINSEEIRAFVLRKCRENLFFSRLGLFIEYFIDQGFIFYIWFSGFIVCYFNFLPSSYAAGLYFIISIPYFWFLIYRFMDLFEKINKEKEYIFINHDYFGRFLFFIKIFLYTFSFIFFFKEALFRIGPLNSSVLMILKALQYIIFQITLIFLIKKEQIVSLIPETNSFLGFLKSLLVKYYSVFIFFIITLIIMSNPYVGYGSQVLYFITRMVLTFIFIPAIYNFYKFIKNKSLRFFVEIEEGELKNKFPAATSCYLVFTVIFYFGSILFLYLLINKIWNLNYNEYDIIEILNKNLVEVTNSGKDGIFYISIIDIFRIIFLTLIGYIASYVFNIFVLKQVLNDVIISVSMQQTVMTLFQYFFVFCSFILSLYSLGLQGLTTKIAFLIGFLGFAIKEPVSDFISYFIILIQRPIKVGDLIKINHDFEIMGIVRKITPRTTLIRQKNSQVIIVPNSLIVTKLVCNWNYTKNNFIAIEDIILNVDFDQDVDLVKLTIQKTLELHSAILKNPAPIVRLEDFTPSGYQFLTRGYILSDRSVELFEITSQLRMLIVKALSQKGIKISAPHYYIKVKKNAKDDKDDKE